MEPQDNLISLLDLALGIAKDRATDKALRRVQEAQREYLLEKVDADRKKGAAIIKAIFKLDQETNRLKTQYNKIESSLTMEAHHSFQQIFQALERQRNQLVQEKKNISREA